MNKVMKKYAILLFIVFASAAMQAQTIDRSVLGASGGFYAFSGGSISSTVGEVIVATAETTNFTLTQGFQQSAFGNVAVSNITKTALKIWPNPTRNFLNIQLPAAVLTANYQIIDNAGKILLSGNILLNQIDVSQLSEGAYQIKLNFNNEQAIAKFLKLGS